MSALTLSSGKHDLKIDPPWMNAAGFLGFSGEGRGLVDPARLGAFVTGPVSLDRRSPAHGQHLLEYPGGFLLHTGLPGPGLPAVLRRHRFRWAALPCPVILHLLAVHPADVYKMADTVGSEDWVAGIELGLVEAQPSEAAALVTAAHASTRPILARLGPDSPRDVAAAAAGAGASALVVGPPRGALPTPEGALLAGRLYGPAILPHALRALERFLELAVCPVIGGGGVYSRTVLDAMFAAGAAAVQLDGILWTEPEVVVGGSSPTSPIGEAPWSAESPPRRVSHRPARR